MLTPGAVSLHEFPFAAHHFDQHGGPGIIATVVVGAHAVGAIGSHHAIGLLERVAKAFPKLMRARPGALQRGGERAFEDQPPVP